MFTFTNIHITVKFISMKYYFDDQVELNEIEDLPRDENTEAREQLLKLFEILFESQVWFLCVTVDDGPTTILWQKIIYPIFINHHFNHCL